jgi:hypothetical protein
LRELFFYHLNEQLFRSLVFFSVNGVKYNQMKKESTKEVWKEIPGFSDYEVSNHGRIRSKERKKKYKSGRTMHLKAKEKSIRKHPSNQFMMTDLIDSKGKRKTVYPHKAVAQAFLENDKPRKKRVVIHLDGNISNNHVDNLKWATYSESIRIGFETGKRDNSKLWETRRAKYGPKGGIRPMGRPDPLSAEQKKELYKLRVEESLTLDQLSKKFNCSISHAHKTIRAMKEQKEKQE